MAKDEERIIIDFDSINVNAIETTSGIFIGGPNLQYGWSSHGKQNSGFGTIQGTRNQVSQLTIAVSDDDFIDTPIDDRDRIVNYTRKMNE